MDLLRGTALLVIHTDHFQANLLASLTPRNFGLSDMAEVFVFLSGCACGKSYGRLLCAGGFAACQKRAAIRVGQIAAACAMTVFVLSHVQGWLGRVAGAAGRGLGSRAAFGGPFRLVAGDVRNVEGAPLVIGILSLYGLLLLALPAMLWLRRVHWGALLIPSFLLYGLAQSSWPFDAQRGFASDLTPFNPLAWQFLFALGILLYDFVTSKRSLAMPGCLLLAAAFLVLECSFIARVSLPRDEIPLVDKATLGPLRVLHLCALVFFSYAVLPGQLAGFWRLLPVRWVVLCGQNSLFVFCCGTILVLLTEGLWLARHAGFAGQLVANMAVWGGCVVAAALWQGAKRRVRPPSSSPLRSA